MTNHAERPASGPAAPGAARVPTPRQPLSPDELARMTGRWVADGLISAPQAEAIQAAEAGAAPPPAAPPTPTAPAVGGASLVTEALAYLGGVLALAATLILTSLVWEDLADWQRLALPALATVALLVAGRSLPVGVTAPAGTRRLRSVLWLLATAALAATLGVLGAVNLDLDPRDAWLMVGVGTAVLAAGLYAVTTNAAQHLALFVALAITVGAIGGRAEWDEPTLVGLGIWLLSATWFALGETDRLSPPHLSRYVGAVGAIVGAMLMGGTGWGHAVALATVAALFVVGVRLNSLPMLGIAAVGTLQTVPQAVAFFFEDEVVVPLALLVTGATLVGVAVVVARRRNAP